MKATLFQNAQSCKIKKGPDPYHHTVSCYWPGVGYITLTTLIWGNLLIAAMPHLCTTFDVPSFSYSKNVDVYQNKREKSMTQATPCWGEFVM